MSRVYFITTNEFKFKFAENIFKKFGIDLIWIEKEYKEIQCENIEEIVVNALKEIEIDPCIVEDSGLFIEALNGFPGFISKFVQEKIGGVGIIKLMKNEKNRSAYFKSIVGVKINNKIKTFSGIMYGRILTEIQGDRRSFDSIFAPRGIKKSLYYARDIETDWHISFKKAAQYIAGELHVRRSTREN